MINYDKQINIKLSEWFKHVQTHTAVFEDLSALPLFQGSSGQRIPMMSLSGNCGGVLLGG
jgi:hypothetical protein